ncbi:transcription factor GTE12-like protein [Trifolium pratense]|uniref:Transcription factor GTE12-like protein n=1 Tax=Trifolium pratense TaxID=57577 RepID=A0A2K3NBV4_TRIPR|nr:transcription factor GTE12-like protein [Trifolium pratense]
MSSSEPRKRLIIRISYPKKCDNSLIHDSIDDQSQGDIKRRKMEHYEKPIVSCYWLDSTISLSQHKKNTNIMNIVADHTTDKNNKKVSTVDHQYSKKFVGNENSKVLSKDTKNHVGCKNIDEGELMKKEKKEPMEQYKRMQCWVILKRMIEGKDGWALKHPLDPKYLNGLEKNIESKVKPIGLKNIEAKLKSYSTPNEFAHDMRLVFSHGMLYPPSDDVYKIAKRFSDIFENKWKTLKIEWGFEDRRRVNKNIHKKVMKMQSNNKKR